MFLNMSVYKEDLTTILLHCVIPTCSAGIKVQTSQAIPCGLVSLLHTWWPGRVTPQLAQLTCKCLACAVPPDEHNFSKQTNKPCHHRYRFHCMRNTEHHFPYNLFAPKPTSGRCKEMHEYQQQFLRVPEDCGHLKIINISF